MIKDKSLKQSNMAKKIFLKPAKRNLYIRINRDLNDLYKEAGSKQITFRSNKDVPVILFSVDDIRNFNAKQMKRSKTTIDSGVKKSKRSSIKTYSTQELNLAWEGVEK